MRLKKIVLLALIALLVTVSTPLASQVQAKIPVFWQVSQSQTIQSEAVQKYEQQPLTIYEPIQNIEWEGMSVSPQGIAYFSLGEVAPDWLLTNESDVDLARANQDRQKEAYALFKLGLANHAISGFFDKAIDYYKQSLEIAREISDRDLEVMLLGNIGLAYVQNGFYYVEPFEYLEEYWGFTWHKGYYYNGGDRRLGGIALGNLGNAYYGADLYAKAIEFHQKRLALSKEIKDRRGEGKALGDMGIVYHALGEYDQAIAYEEQRLSISQEIKDRRGEGQALSNLGIIYHTLGDYNKVIEYQQQYLTISREIKNPLGEEQALGNLGGAYYFLGDYPKAIDFYEKSLAIAWNIRESQMANKIRSNLGLVYFQMKDYKKAMELYERAFAAASYSDSRRGEAVARNNLAAANLNSGNLTASKTNLIKGIERLESLRERLKDNDAYKVSIFETQNAPYINLQKILSDQNQPDDALVITERGRARAFVELLAKRLKYRQTELANINQLHIDEFKAIAKQQNATIVEYSFVLENYKLENRIQTRESELLIWVIKPTGEVALRRQNLASLWQKQNIFVEDLVVSSRSQLSARGLPMVAMRPRLGTQLREKRNIPKSLQQLHQLLIEPIADLLPSDPNDHVIFIPQGQLFLIPFPALQDKEGKYLIEKHTILTAPAIQVLDLTRKQRERLQTSLTPDFLVVGNPTMPSVPPAPGEPPQQLSSLPGAEAEAKAIAPILNTKAIVGKDATKAAIVKLLPSAQIVHLATHGLLDDIRGIGSAIALAPSGKDDGLLTAEQILDLKLNAELVVLSACNTGRGRITGDGVIGLSRSLISAGVPSVIVSLWSVPDAPTALLMTEFYQNLQKNTDKAQALRQAMITTMKQYPAPKDWAAFTLIGEAK
jgi:CHAT domain-containing protein